MDEFIIGKEIKLDKTLGYEYINDPNHPLSNKSGKVYVHRIVASNKLGRWILPEEVVHHVDGVKRHNDPENLVILSASEHAKLEIDKRVIRRELIFCAVCGEHLERPSKTGLCRDCWLHNNPEFKGRKKRRYNKNYYTQEKGRSNGEICLVCGKLICNNTKNKLCSSCLPKSKRKFEISKEDLEKLIWEMPTVKIASLLGVSDKSIEKRCKLFGINKPPVGYWNKVKAGRI
jgi:hypothetical protein